MKIKYSLYQTFIFCGFLISGSLKFLFTYYESFVDITLLFTILITVDIIYNLLFRRFLIRFNHFQFFILTAFFIFYSLFFISLLYSASEVYSYKKTIYFSLSLLAFIYPIHIRKLDLDLFAKITELFAIPISIWFIVVKHLYAFGHRDMVSPNIIPLLGAYGGLALCIAFLMLYYVEKKKLNQFSIMVLLILALGSRGVLLFIIIIIAIWKYKEIIKIITGKHKIKLKINAIKIIFLVVTIPILLFFRNAIMLGFKYGLLRFSSFLSFSSDKSNNGRIEYYEFAISKIFESVNSIFLGYGIGSFGILFSGEESREIPHNIYLEAWFELGIIGLILIITITVLPLLMKHKNEIIKIVAIFFLLDSMKSGGFDQMRFMFGIYGSLTFLNKDNFS